MAAATENTLSKVDSLVEEAPAKKGHRRASSLAPDVYNINEVEQMDDGKGGKVKLAIDPATLSLNWKVNTSPSTIDDRDVLKKPLTTPKIKKVDLQFPLGLHVTARNLKGVTIKDAVDAIHKQFKKKADDELDNAYLRGFEWNPEEDNTRFIVHLKATGEAKSAPSKKKKKGGDE